MTVAEKILLNLGSEAKARRQESRVLQIEVLTRPTRNLGNRVQGFQMREGSWDLPRTKGSEKKKRQRGTERKDGGEVEMRGKRNSDGQENLRKYTHLTGKLLLQGSIGGATLSFPKRIKNTPCMSGFHAVSSNSRIKGVGTRILAGKGAARNKRGGGGGG